MLLEEHKKLKGLISKVGATNLGKGGDKNMMRNPNQFMGKLQSMLDPKMMAQLGGAGNLMNMMKEMSSKSVTPMALLSQASKICWWSGVNTLGGIERRTVEKLCYRITKNKQ